MSENLSCQYLNTENNTATSLQQPSTVGDYTKLSIENELIPPEKSGGEASTFVIFIKWFVALVLFGCMFVAVLTSKISFLMVGEHYRQLQIETRKLDNNNTEIEKLHRQRGYNKESIFITLILFLLVPQGISLLMSAWSAMNRQKGIPWPSTRALLWVSYLSARVHVIVIIIT